MKHNIPLTIVLLSSLLPALASAQTPSGQTQQSQESLKASQFDRDGFVISIDGGLGGTMIRSDGADSESGLGPAGLNISLGSYLTSKFALMVRASGNRYSATVTEASSDSFDTDVYNVFFGPVAQYWVRDKIAIEAGVGYGAVTYVDSRAPSDQMGLGMNLRGTYRITRGLQASIESSVTLHEGGNGLGQSLLIGYQWD